VSASVHFRAHQPDEADEAMEIADQVTGDKDVSVGPTIPLSMAAARSTLVKKDPKADAASAKEAAEVANKAAAVANKVAKHSIHITAHAKKALEKAQGALHDARVETEGLNQGQKESLKKAEAKLREATKKADYGKLEKVDNKKQKMQDRMDKKRSKKHEVETMREEIKRLRAELKEKGGGEEEDKDLKEVEEMLNDPNADEASTDELKAETERLRERVDKMEKKKESAEKSSSVKVKTDDEDEEKKEELMKDVHISPLGSHHASTGRKEARSYRIPSAQDETTPVEEKGIDIDTQMPYGDLEPFGREDTAQELTESSVKESDEMVDQLERAEVAEEKRAVFRALTRLRGAAITSFDGVARSQTGNIDEYNKVHKWRNSHPLHHLADEESDVQKWAFPDNAD